MLNKGVYIYIYINVYRLYRLSDSPVEKHLL